jgi:hypothetical protein
MKILTHKQTGFKRVVGNYGSSGGFPTLTEALKDYERVKRNAIKRERNEILRDLTGTSAASARRDMGLAS